MRKRATRFLAICALVLSLLTGCAFASPEAAPAPVAADEAALRVFDDPYTGVRFTLPEVWYTAAYETENLFLANYEFGLDVSYISAEGQRILDQLMESIEAMPEDATDYTQEQKDLIEKLNAEQIPVCLILAEDQGADSALKQYYQDLRALYPKEKALGEAEGTVYTLLYFESGDVTDLPEEDMEPFAAILAAVGEIEKDLTLTGIKSLGRMGGEIAFDSVTLAGEPIDAGVFSGYKLTAINVWATWCNPCVSEMPELQKVYESLPEGVNLISVCTDGADDPETAELILEKTGVKYEVVIPSKEMEEGFLSYINAIPTTIFVDSQGRMVGEPIVGVPGGGSDVAKAYLSAMEERLGMLGE